MANGTIVPPAWVTPRTGLPLDLIIQYRDEVLAAISKVIRSGTQEYHVGSRGLKRLSLKELQDLLVFWMNEANYILNGGSSIQTRRGLPCDR